jgi:hypothetical protein
LKEIRRQCAVEFSRHDGSWIICANHLTMIDSFIVDYAFFSLGQYIINYRKLPWNLPVVLSVQMHSHPSWRVP